MISPKHITKLTAVGLVVGAFAAPAASAMPFGGIPTQASLHRAPVGWLLDPSAFSPAYSRQDKQLLPTSQTPAPPPAPVRYAKPSGGSDWVYAEIGEGGALMVALASFGVAAISQRRSPKPALLAAT